MRQHGTTLGIATVSSLRARQGGVNARRSADVAQPTKAAHTRAKSFPPPPPLAAYVQRTDRPAPIAHTAPQAPSAASLRAALPKIVQTPCSEWFDSSSDHFGSSVRAPKPGPRAWGKIIAGLGIGAVAVLGASFVSRPFPFHNGPVLYSDRPTTALASAQHSAWVGQAKTAHGGVQPAAVAEPATPAPVVAPIAPIAPVAPVARDAPKALLPAALVLPPLAALPVAPSLLVEGAADAAAARVAHHAKLTMSAKRAAPHSESNAAVGAAAETHPAAVTTTNEELPAQPSREQIKNALTAMRPTLEACSANTHGTMFANLNITGAGRVTYSNIEGAFAGSVEGSCMARALRTAAFPRFASASLKVRYPFVL